MDSPGKPKRPIDALRDSACGMDVGAPEEGPLTGFVTFGDRLLVVKPKAVYEIMMADSIDPGRTNAAIPNAQQRVLTIGSDSPLLGRTLLTAHALFLPDYLRQVIDCDTAMESAFCATRDLVAMNDEYVRLKAEVEAIRTGIASALLKQGFQIPAIADLEARSKAVLQRAHHFVKATLDVAKLFYGPKIKHPDSLLTFFASADAEDPIRKFLDEVVPTLRFIWLTRNAVEHPKPSERIVVRNFALQPDGALAFPTIEVIHPTVPQPAVSVVGFIGETSEALATIFEVFVAHLAARHARFGNFGISVMELPVDRRREPYVRFSYATNIRGQWEPLG